MKIDDVRKAYSRKREKLVERPADFSKVAHVIDPEDPTVTVCGVAGEIGDGFLYTLDSLLSSDIQCLDCVKEVIGADHAPFGPVLFPTGHSVDKARHLVLKLGRLSQLACIPEVMYGDAVVQMRDMYQIECIHCRKMAKAYLEDRDEAR